MTDETDYQATCGDVYDQQWKALSGWFLGPRAENRDVFVKLFTELFDKHADTRRSYYPTDPPYITSDMRASKEYAAEVEDMRKKLFAMSDELCESVPFFSPRYQAHMLWDVTMPSLLGYMISMLHGQNNVDTAASSVTTPYEKAVGLQLCDMLGYNIESNNKEPKAWGHITCGGSIANIEAVWASRNIKYSAIAVQYAVLNASADILSEQERTEACKYEVNVPVKVSVSCDGTNEEYYEWKPTPLSDCTTAQLLNMDIDDYCDLVKNVANAACLTGVKLDNFGAWIEKNSYTSLGAQKFTQLHKINAGVYTCPANCHYSWPKAGTLLGLGSDALIPLPLDDDFRQDVKVMEQELIKCAENETPVFSVTAVMGSTEESAVDPILKIWNLRNVMKRKYGLNFAILADGAWGGYFKTMIIGEPKKERLTHEKDFVPFIPLTKYVTEQYENIQLADTITIDPHKSGFCPYPAGALCYRNGAMRNFIAILHPEVYHGEDDPTMGVYGIEGSKPGAAPSGVLMSHQVIGLDVYGYGRILGQCTTTCKIFYCLWLTLARPDDPFVCVPLQKLPEKYLQPHGNTGITLGQHLIKTKILGKSMSKINEDVEAMELLRECGPDTLINTFVINMKNEDGSINKDVKKANELQKAIADDLNVTVGVCAHRVPFIIMQSGLNKNHGEALVNYKERIGLERDTDDSLNVMVNSTMNPWQWSESIALAGDVFRWNILNSLGKMKDGEQFHEFIVCCDVQNQVVFAEYIPSFSVPESQYQIVVKLKVACVNENIKQGSRIRSMSPIKLREFLCDNNNVNFNVHDGEGCDLGHVNLTVMDIPRYQHFDMSKHTVYNEKQSYFIYGDEERVFMSHCMKKSPDFMQVIQLDAPPYGLTSDLIELGVEVTLPDLDGRPKVIDSDIVDPLDNSSYTIAYRGRQYAKCTSTMYLERSNSKVFFKSLS